MSNAALDKLINKYVDPSQTNGSPLPLVVAAVHTKDKGLVYLNSSGYRDTETKKPCTVDTNIAFYSTTKEITATALLQLLEQGKIHSIDDLVEKYVDDAKHLKIISSWDNEKNIPVLKDITTKPTIRHLLTHTAGFAYAFFNNNYKKLQDSTGVPSILNSTWKDFNTPLAFEPGTKWHYGTNTDWVGKVVYEVSGLTLDEYLKKNIFKPIGANSLTFIKSPEQKKNESEIHVRENTRTGLPKPFRNIHPDVPEFHAGGHGLFGKIEDYLKFLEIFLHEGKSPQTGVQILKPETVKNYVFSNLLPKGVEMSDSLEFPDPILSSPFKLTDAVPGNKQAWTATFHQYLVDLPTGRSAGAGSWYGLPNLLFWVDPKKGIAAMVATQLFPFWDDNAVKLENEFEAEVYKQFT